APLASTSPPVASSAPPRSNGSPSEPQAQGAAPRPRDSAPEGNDARWDELLAFVQLKKPSVYFNLSHARWLGGGAGNLVLGVSKEKFRSGLASRTTLALLEEGASVFF